MDSRLCVGPSFHGNLVVKTVDAIGKDGKVICSKTAKDCFKTAEADDRSSVMAFLGMTGFEGVKKLCPVYPAYRRLAEFLSKLANHPVSLPRGEVVVKSRISRDLSKAQISIGGENPTVGSDYIFYSV